jgi:hypothetical protein
LTRRAPGTPCHPFKEDIMCHGYYEGMSRWRSEAEERRRQFALLDQQRRERERRERERVRAAQDRELRRLEKESAERPKTQTR